MRNFCLIILLLTSCLAYSQNKSRHHLNHRTQPQVAAVAEIDTLEFYPEDSIEVVYEDSLQELKIIVDSIYNINYVKDETQNYDNTDSRDSAIDGNEADAGSVNSRYARLFIPVTFYKDIPHRHFTVGDDEQSTTSDQQVIDDALINIYLKHPELVKGEEVSANNKGKVKAQNAEALKGLAVAKILDTYQAPKAQEGVAMDQVNILIKKPNFWTFSGEYFLQMMQNFYSGNWYQGGESSISGLTRISMHADYNNKQKFKWENTLDLNFGLQTNSSDSVHSVKTSSDLIRWTSKVGVQATKKWYYTLQTVLSTQFAKTFDANSNVEKSAFMSPCNLNVSLGMDYNISWFNNKLTGSAHLAPGAMNWKYVKNIDLAVANGIDEDKHSKIDFGTTFTIDTNWKITNSFNWHSRLYGYTTYKRMELQWENTFNLKISKILAASIYIYPRFDDSSADKKDDSFGYFQLKEYTSIGLTWSF